MFRGVYGTSGPVEELAITRGLRKSSSDSVELDVHGPLAVAGGEFAGKATIDGISCVLGGNCMKGIVCFGSSISRPKATRS